MNELRWLSSHYFGGSLVKDGTCNRYALEPHSECEVASIDPPSTREVFVGKAADGVYVWLVKVRCQGCGRQVTGYVPGVAPR